MSTAPSFMSFSDGVNTQLSPIPTIAPSMSDVPDWIRTSILPHARPDTQPLLDIYAEVIALRDQIQYMEREQRTQSLALAELLETSRRRPIAHILRWLQRLRDKFTFTSEQS